MKPAKMPFPHFQEVVCNANEAGVKNVRNSRQFPHTRPSIGPMAFLAPFFAFFHGSQWHFPREWVLLAFLTRPTKNSENATPGSRAWSRGPLKTRLLAIWLFPRSQAFLSSFLSIFAKSGPFMVLTSKICKFSKRKTQENNRKSFHSPQFLKLSSSL